MSTLRKVSYIDSKIDYVVSQITQLIIDFISEDNYAKRTEKLSK